MCRRVHLEAGKEEETGGKASDGWKGKCSLRHGRESGWGKEERYVVLKKPGGMGT